jgi:hypothetical protein
MISERGMRSPDASSTKVIVWVVIWLAVIDVAINFAFDSKRPWAGRVLGLTRYFNYGRSIEGKLSDSLGPLVDKPNAIVHAGWIDPQQWVDLPSKANSNGDLSVAVYGQSFAFDAAKSMQEMDRHMTLRLIGGPAAPLSHSFAAYRSDSPTRNVDVVIIGILASSLAKSDSISALSWTFESPAPYTFPRFSLDYGKLIEVTPLITTESEFREAFRTRRETWRDFKEQLKVYDKGYSALSFNESILDHSALLRLMRRGWASSLRQYENEERDVDGSPRYDQAQIQVAVELLRQLRQMTSAAGEQLVVVLLHDRGFDQTLYRALGPALDQMHVRYISTHQFFSSRDPGKFVSDGHYIEAANNMIAHELLRSIRVSSTDHDSIRRDVK